MFRIGSLFSGSGGFELAATLCGMEPIWASEIEPFPIRVTTKRFPHLKHYGDISSIIGSDLEPVDLITGGSPCQDMSVAGKRKGMSKECPKCGYKSVANEDADICPECGSEMQYTRSGLFMEQIRVIKEMREADEKNGRSDQSIRPRFMLWENVVGAFSSNKGEDFRAVLEETAKVKDKTATIPRPPKGKWNTEGCIVGDGWSIAWRVLDAQFWGVPQRRRRIALVADFAGQCAGEILFKREGLSRNFTESRKSWQGIAGDTSKGIDASSEHCIGFEPGAATRTGGHTYDNQTGSLRANMVDNQFCVAKKEQYAVDFGRVADRIQMNATKAVTLQGLGGGSGAKTGLYCLPKDAPPIGINGTVAGTLDSNYYKGPGERNGVERECVAVPVTMQVRCGNPNGGGKGALLQINKSATLSCGVPQTLFDPIHCVENSTGRNTLFMTTDVSPALVADTHNHAYCVPIQDMAISNGRDNDLRPSHRIDGYKESETMYTLNTTEQHAVAYGFDRASFNQGINAKYDISITTEQSQTLVSRGPNAVAQPFEMKAFGKYDESEKASCLKTRDYKDSTDLIVEPSYIVRRLTPIECSRLQGFPDWWLDGLETEEPTEQDIAFWREVFETHRNVVTGAKKPKTDKQIIKWLQNPYSDGAEYKLWGNGIALPCFLYVMEGIKEVLDRTSNE